jgi:hypothetical protein
MKRRDKQMFIAPASMPLPMQGLPSSVAPTTPATLCQVSAAGAPPGTHGKLTCSETALSGGSGGTDAGPTSQQSQIDIQVRTATADIACNTHTEGLLLEAWTAYRTFTERRGTLPARLEDISPADLARFVAHARSAQQNIDALLMMLTMLGSLLVHAGYNRRVLATLTAAVRRKRVQNARNGKYSHEKRLVEPHARGRANSENEC